MYTSGDNLAVEVAAGDGFGQRIGVARQVALGPGGQHIGHPRGLGRLLGGADALGRQGAVVERPGGVAARLAALLVAAAQDGRNVVTFWSYAERLETVGEWFRQLWAESLGKPRPDGVRVGQTPLHCVGSTDQHSIQQLMVEGPPDKAVVVLAGPPTGDVTAPAGAPGAGAGSC